MPQEDRPYVKFTSQPKPPFASCYTKQQMRAREQPIHRKTAGSLQVQSGDRVHSAAEATTVRAQLAHTEQPKHG